MSEVTYILSKAGKPLAKLVPLHRPPEPRQPGGWEGQVRISDDFDAPLPPEIQDAFEGRGYRDLVQVDSQHSVSLRTGRGD